MSFKECVHLIKIIKHIGISLFILLYYSLNVERIQSDSSFVILHIINLCVLSFFIDLLNEIFFLLQLFGMQ